MSALIVAASTGAVVEQIGSYAGLASTVGLGVLALLYFSQAREVRRLREWADTAPERAQEAIARGQGDVQRRVIAQPIAAPSTVAAQQAAASLYAQPPAPGPAAPAAAPPVPPAGQLARPAPATIPPATAPTAPAPATIPPAVGAPASAATTVAPPSPSGPPPAIPAAASPSASRSPSLPLPASNGAGGQETHESAAARPAPLPDLPPLPDLSVRAQSDYDDDAGGFSFGRIGAIVGGAVAVVVVAVLLMVLLGGGEEPAPPNDFGSSTQTAPADEPATAADPSAVDRRATNVAVLNGTTQTGLARAVADKLEQGDFTIANVGNNTDQQVPTTIVSYAAGNEQAAAEVATVIELDASAIQPADANTAVAAAEADVVVTVGTDQIE